MMFPAKTVFFSLCCFTLLVASSCKKNDNPSGSATVSTTVTSGTWKVTYYLERDADHTSSFAGYTFTFNSNGTVTAVKTGDTVNGTWSAGNDDSRVKFILNFIAPDPFREISEDWRVTERTNNKLRLEDTSGGDDHIDYLTFEKN